MNDSEAEFKQTLLPGSTLILQLSANHEDFCGEEPQSRHFHPPLTFQQSFG